MTSPSPRGGFHHQVDGTTYFLLVGSQRCGTNFCRELLQTHPALVVHGEILMPYPLPNCWHNFVRTMVNRAMPPMYAKDCTDLFDDYLIYLNEDVKRGYPGKVGLVRAVGLDIKYNQLRFIAPLIRDLEQKPFLLDYCWRKSMPIVHMTRANVVHQALSLVIAAARNVYHNYGGAKIEGKVRIEPQAVVEHAQWVHREVEAFRRMTGGHNVLELSYEDLAHDLSLADADGKIPQKGKALPKVAAFLGVDSDFRRPSTIKKVIDRPYKDVIENHAEVYKALRASEWKKLADTI